MDEEAKTKTAAAVLFNDEVIRFRVPADAKVTFNQNTNIGQESTFTVHSKDYTTLAIFLADKTAGVFFETDDEETE